MRLKWLLCRSRQAFSPESLTTAVGGACSGAESVAELEALASVHRLQGRSRRRARATKSHFLLGPFFPTTCHSSVGCGGGVITSSSSSLTSAQRAPGAIDAFATSRLRVSVLVVFFRRAGLCAVDANPTLFYSSPRTLLVIAFFRRLIRVGTFEPACCKLEYCGSSMLRHEQSTSPSPAMKNDQCGILKVVYRTLATLGT